MLKTKTKISRSDAFRVIKLHSGGKMKIFVPCKKMRKIRRVVYLVMLNKHGVVGSRLYESLFFFVVSSNMIFRCFFHLRFLY